MQIHIHFAPGFQVEGVVLSVAGDTMRVAVRDWDDAAVFHRSHGQWLAENGDPVRIDGAGVFSHGPQGNVNLRTEVCPSPSWVN